MTVDTDIPTSGYPPEQLASYKGYLRSEAYAILGKLSSDSKNWPDAEDQFAEVDRCISAAGGSDCGAAAGGRARYAEQDSRSFEVCRSSGGI